MRWTALDSGQFLNRCGGVGRIRRRMGGKMGFERGAVRFKRAGRLMKVNFAQRGNATRALGAQIGAERWFRHTHTGSNFMMRQSA